jgi:hypothetical protein
MDVQVESASRPQYRHDGPAGPPTVLTMDSKLDGPAGPIVMINRLHKYKERLDKVLVDMCMFVSVYVLKTMRLRAAEALKE